MPERVLDGIDQRYESKSNAKRTAKQKPRQLIRRPLVDHDESRNRQDRVSDDLQWRRHISHICRPFGRRPNPFLTELLGSAFHLFLDRTKSPKRSMASASDRRVKAGAEYTLFISEPHPHVGVTKVPL